MLFENQTVLALEDFLLLQAAWEKHKSPLRRMKQMQRLCFALPGVILLLIGLPNLLAAFRQWSLSLLPMTLLSLLLTVFGLFLLLWPSGSRLARRNWQKYPQKGSVLTYRFAQDSFTQHSRSGTAETPYEALVDLMEDERTFLLFFSDLGAHVLHKDSFTVGDADSFRAFLSKRTGLPMQKV